MMLTNQQYTDNKNITFSVYVGHVDQYNYSKLPHPTVHLKPHQQYVQ